MVEPDCNGEEAKVLEEAPKKIPSEEISNKRSREEASDSDQDLASKKARLDESPTREESCPVKSDDSQPSNDVQEKEDNDQSKTSSSHTNNEKDDECSKADKQDATKSTVAEKERVEGKKVQDVQENDQDAATALDGESDKHDLSSKNQVEKKDQSAGDDEADKETSKQKSKKKNEQSEIINGVELVVECASDQESSEESEKEENSKPRPKTEIVREKPLDSEVDASSSEAEKSDSCKVIEAKSQDDERDTPVKQVSKRGRKKSASLKEAAASGSESNTEDEDYSPVAKKKVKKSPIASKTPQVKRGRGRPRGRPPKNAVKPTRELSDDESEEKKETSSDEAEKQNDKKSKETKDSDKADSKTEDSAGQESDEKSDNESDESEDVKQGKRRKPSKRNIKKIENLKKFIRAAGIRVKCYTTLLKGCETDAAKAKRLTEFLHEHGVVGRPTLDKCNKIRIKNETLKEIQELDTSSIISETRSTRGRNARKTQSETKAETKISGSDQKASETFKRIRAVADSDSE